MIPSGYDKERADVNILDMESIMVDAIRAQLMCRTEDARSTQYFIEKNVHFLSDKTIINMISAIESHIPDIKSSEFSERYKEGWKSMIDSLERQMERRELKRDIVVLDVTGISGFIRKL